MIIWAGDNIISALGLTSEANYKAVKAGTSGIALHNATSIAEPFQASLINREQLDDTFNQHFHSHTNTYTTLEKAAILSAHTAATTANIDISSPDALFILSTTKGNIHLLDTPDQTYDPRKLHLWHTAQLIAKHFNNTNEPITISNACISGLCAQITAIRELSDGRYTTAVVIGIDLLSRFIISGFQSLKALSPKPCQPFDDNRSGLNLGEAAATIIYRKTTQPPNTHITLVNGSITNDANHISGPSRTAEGSYAALTNILQQTNHNNIAFINAHGTATPYNDRMEAIAITRAKLNNTPVNSLKGNFGHTLGAAGILESIISTHALTDNTILPTHNFTRGENEYPLNIPTKTQHSTEPYCIKMMSGFGGCNAALLFKKNTHNGTIH